MKKIVSVPPPPIFAYYRAQRVEYSGLSSDSEIRKALWLEQGGRCGYCERRLADPSQPGHGTRIEHFHPQSSKSWESDCGHCSGAPDNNAAPTTWSNMLLCCNGNENVGGAYTCDKSKADQDICAKFRNPKRWHQEMLVIIDSNGNAIPATGLPVDAQDVIDKVLNLNADHLVTVRKEIISARRKLVKKVESKHRGLTTKMRLDMATAIREYADDREYTSTLLSFANRLQVANAKNS
ncbi:hypothetical protein [Pseudarthrobacter sp. NIBRBAC000502771]|uniref:hypothetical protein n=1 Tax=Pseudarthrobacter sp. NIBRBAC000502771 TaxID=2590774 RepID=UPI00112FFF16|nr:hypothetical protein [Pseudarthrobacter sp. NIBRBAC000502771]QDG64429.1 hypothetical protein NIBR502771_20365 [Pseudarthrobacter sp. NIBRBAC000502771]